MKMFMNKKNNFNVVYCSRAALNYFEATNKKKV